MHDYHPTKTVLDRLRGVHFVGVVGPTGAGKTTIINTAAPRDASIHMIVSDVTRPPRPGEQDGIDYRFQTHETMERIIAGHGYVNVAPSLNGNDIYATHPDCFPQDGVGVMAIFAEVVPEFRGLPFASCRIIYIVPPDAATWLERAGAHQFTAEQKVKRFGEAARSLRFAVSDPQVVFVVNDDLETATTDFLTIAHSAPMALRLQDDQQRGREIAAAMLRSLES